PARASLSALRARFPGRVAPPRPRAGVVVPLLDAERVRERVPGLAGPFADTAVGDDLGRPVGDLRALVQLPQLLVRLEGPVRANGLTPRDVLRAGDVTRPLRRLGHAGRRDDLAHEFRLRPHVHQADLLGLESLLHVGTPRADGRVHLRRHRIGRRADAWAIGDERPTLRYPLRPPAVHQLRVRVAV